MQLARKENKRLTIYLMNLSGVEHNRVLDIFYFIFGFYFRGAFREVYFRT